MYRDYNYNATDIVAGALFALAIVLFVLLFVYLAAADYEPTKGEKTYTHRVNTACAPAKPLKIDDKGSQATVTCPDHSQRIISVDGDE